MLIIVVLYLIGTAIALLYYYWPSNYSKELNKSILDNDFNMAKILIDSASKNNKNDGGFLLAAAYSNRFKIFKYMLTRGFNPNGYINGVPLLNCICNLNYYNPQYVKLLLRYGANPNSMDKNGYTPLMVAIESCSEVGVALLLRHGADVHAMKTISTPPESIFELAVKHGNKIIIANLKKYAPGYDYSKYSSLLNAPAGWYSLQRKKFILSVPGININVRNGEGATPLITATIQKDFEYVKLLLENGANVHAKDNNGMTAMDWAKELKQKQIISELCRAMQKTRPIKK